MVFMNSILNNNSVGAYCEDMHVIVRLNEVQ